MKKRMLPVIMLAMFFSVATLSIAGEEPTKAELLKELKELKSRVAALENALTQVKEKEDK